MTIKAILFSQKKKNGTQNIKIYVNYNGKKKYIKTPFSVEEKFFDKAKGSIKNTYPNAFQVNAYISKQKRELEDFFLEGGEVADIEKINNKSSSLLVFLTQYISLIKAGKTEVKKSTGKNYSSLLSRLKEYQHTKYLKDINFNDIDLLFYEDFKTFLFANGCGLPGFGKHIKILKTIMRIAQDKNLHKNEIYKHNLFKRIRSPKNTNKIYLTEAEIDQLKGLDLSNSKNLEKERDRFLLCYYFLMRFEDSRQIKKDMIFEKDNKNYIRYTQQKTGHTCILPIKSDAWLILEKLNFQFDFSSNQQANREIKTICAMAKINSEINIEEQKTPKWKLVTTHTARRSAATNLSLNNVSLKIIADLGGWTDLDTLRVYLRNSGIDSAMVAKDLDFFD